MIHRHKERSRTSASAERNTPATEHDLETVSGPAQRLWKEIRNHGNDAVNSQDGLSARFDHTEEVAYVTHSRGPAHWATTAVGFDNEGVWQIVSTHYGPGLENEEQGAIVGHATTYPLAVGRNRFSVSTSYRQMNDGRLEVESVGDVGELEPISAATAHTLNEQLSGLANDAVLRRTLGMMAAATDAEITGG